MTDITNLPSPYIGTWRDEWAQARDGGETDREAIADDFRVDLAAVPTEDETLVAIYHQEAYSGDAYVLWADDAGRLMVAVGDHCSCMGLEDQWEPEETSIDAELMRQHRYRDGEIKAVIVARYEALTGEPCPPIPEPPPPPAPRPAESRRAYEYRVLPSNMPPPPWRTSGQPPWATSD